MNKTDISTIPEILKSRDCWVKFKTSLDDGKLKKRLLNPHTSKWASINDASTWGTFDKACSSVRDYGGDGVATLLNGDGIWCIDLDGCVGDDGKFSDLAQKLMREYSDTYTELSVSGNGVHIFGKGKIPSGYMSKNSNDGIELYSRDRFISMTGNCLSKTRELADCTEKLKSTCEEYLKIPEQAKTNSTSQIQQEKNSDLLQRIRKSKSGEKFFRLFDGQDAADKSSGDFSLCLQLAFWCNRDKTWMDSVFRESSRMRPKWDEKHGKDTYGSITLDNAIRCNSNTRNTGFYDTQKTASKSTQKTDGNKKNPADGVQQKMW